MAQYEQIPLAGNQDAQNVFQITFATNPCSDLPQVTAWDDYNMNTVAIQSIAGTVGNGSKSSVLIADTSDASSGDDWATDLTQTPGGASANRCKGNDSYVELGSVAPGAGDTRTFQMAIAVHSSFGAGTTGHTPVIGIKTFYTGSAPTVTVKYNSANNETPTWVTLNTQTKGVSTPPSLPYTVYATGPDTTVSSLDPVTKPETGEAFAEEYWSRTV
jgi:hypothetical protein